MKVKRSEKNLCIKLWELFKNKFAALSRFEDSQDLSEQLSSHFIFFKSKS